MDKNQQYYKNKNNYENICVPVREGFLNYLIKEKFLSEFSTEEEKLQVLENLGIIYRLNLLRQLINNKADVSLLSRYVTEDNLVRRLEELRPKDEKSKGYYSSYEELLESCPEGQEGDWAIVNIGGTWYVYKYKINKWVSSGTYDISLDLSEYAKLIDLENLQPLLLSGVNIKTINGESVLGEGDIEIQGGSGTTIDLSDYVTKEDLYNLQNPLKATIYVSPTLVEYTGTVKNISINCVVKKGDTTVIPDSIELKYRGITANIGRTYTAEVHEKGITTFNATCYYGEETATCSGTVNLVLPTYLGFSSEETPENLNFQDFTKKVVSNMTMTETLQNTVSGNYLWIVSPYRLEAVATDRGFTYEVRMLTIDNINDLYYYRSNSALDISNLTYYIK